MIDAEILPLLRDLTAHIKAGDQAAQLATIERIGLRRLFDVATIVCALTVGGVGLANFIAELGTEHAGEPERYREILEVLAAAPARPNGTELAVKIISAGGVEDAEAYFCTLQEDLLRLTQPNDHLALAVVELKRGKWAAALAGFTRSIAELAEKTPPVVFAHAAHCLHKLGRYPEAEEMNLRGLGPQRDVIAPKSTPPPEPELVAQWTRRGAPVISILCVTYNHARYIDATIRGFLTQRTDFSFEILIHDDASFDGTAAKVRVWQDQYPSVIRAILQTENQYSRGVRPFDLLLKQARGRYVALCEGDDYWLEPTKLQKQVGFLEAHPDFSCSAHNYYLYNESLPFVRRWSAASKDRVLTPAQLMSITRLLWCPTVVFRKSFDHYPPERQLVSLGDQFLTSFLGIYGSCAYFDSFVGSVRRENQYSSWTPAAELQKNRARVRTWAALVAMHERLGNREAVVALRKRIAGCALDATEKSTLLEAALQSQAVLAPAL